VIAGPRSLFVPYNSLLGCEKFPARDSSRIPLSTGLLGSICRSTPPVDPKTANFPSKFPDIREFAAETGSYLTAHTTTQSYPNPKFQRRL
jgi:hypothetical protein